MSVPHDVLYRYTDGLERGLYDRDLSPEDRENVVRLLRQGIAILSQYGAMPRERLARMLADPYGSPPAVNERVRDILFGCMADGWTRTGLA